jgi:hypothetical protein
MALPQLPGLQVAEVGGLHLLYAVHARQLAGESPVPT